MQNIYIIDCNEGYFYIASAVGLSKNLIDHFSKINCDWVKIHKPKEVIDIIKNEKYTDFYVLEYMHKYGIKYVRGGSYSNIILSLDELNLLEDLLPSKINCKYCNGSGHNMSNCAELKKLKDNNYIKSMELVETETSSVYQKNIMGHPHIQKISFTIKSIEFTFKDKIKEMELFLSDISQLIININKSITDFNGFQLNNDCFWPISKILYNNFKDDFHFLFTHEELNLKCMIKSRLTLREKIVIKILRYIKYYSIHKFTNMILDKNNELSIDNNTNSWNLWNYIGSNPKKYTFYDFIVESLDNIEPQNLHGIVRQIYQRSNIPAEYLKEFENLNNNLNTIKYLVKCINSDSVDIIIKNIRDYKVFIEHDKKFECL